MASNRSGVYWRNKTHLGLSIAKFDATLDARIAVLIDRNADVGTRYMKENAPWTDRTGNARSTLKGDPSHTHRVHSITLHGGMPYQIYLEIMQNGRFAIIRPTMIWLGRKTMSMARLLMAGGAA